MSDKKLSLLGIAAAASIVLAVFVWQFAGRSKQTSTAQGGNLIQGLDPAVIAEIATGKGNEQIRLKRRGGGFVVANKNFYPASNRAINDLLAACLDIRTVELYTEDKANYKDLGVSDENAKDIVKFLDSNGKIITGVIIGNTREDGRMAYGRLINDDKVYIIYNPPWIKSSPLDYIETELISVNKADISSVTVTSPNETYTLIGEANGTSAVLKEQPGGKKEKKKECLAVLDALTNLRFDDVNAATEKTDLNFDRKYTCLLKDSTLYTIEIAQSAFAEASADKKDSKTFVKCGAEFTDKTPVRKEEAVESQEELKKKEAKFLAREKAKKFGDACEGWIYQIGGYKAKNLTKPLAELVEDIPLEPNSATADKK
jgi:hypothetical protein